MGQRCYVRTPIGRLGIEEEEGAIIKLYVVQEAVVKAGEIIVDDTSVGEDKIDKTVADEIHAEEMSDMLKRVQLQLTEYFEGRRKVFDLPINPKGTEFQKKVWKALCNIPYGKTRSYGEIAAQIGNPKASRAVGGANNKNPILLLIPCHRVIGADGTLTGFGCGLHIKEHLLNLEKENKEKSI